MTKNFESFDSEKSEKSLNEIDLSELVDSLDEYNKQFNWGTMATREMIFDEENEGGLAKEDVDAEKTNSLAELEQKHREELEKTGLSLEPVKGIATIFTPEGDDIETSEMRINLVDGKRFVDYISVLDEDSLTEQQIRGLITVADSLTKQLVYQYNLTDPNDERVTELFGSLSQIIDEYHRLDKRSKSGLLASVEQLEKYLEVARKKYLKEYLLAEKAGFLEGAEGKYFGPSNWHTDSNPESYRRYWDEAIKKVIEIGKNKNARNFQNEVIGNLKRTLVRVKKDLKIMFEKRLKRQEKDEKNPDIVIFTKLTKEGIEKEIEEYRVVLDDVYDQLEEI